MQWVPWFLPSLILGFARRLCHCACAEPTSPEITADNSLSPSLPFSFFNHHPPRGPETICSYQDPNRVSYLKSAHPPQWVSCLTSSAYRGLKYVFAFHTFLLLSASK
jgi:hypothetical protein